MTHALDLILQIKLDLQEQAIKELAGPVAKSMLEQLMMQPIVTFQ